MVDRVSLVGLRWGATLAALAARGRDDVDQIVLWDPVVSGAAYLDDRLGTPRPTGVVGIEGYPFSDVLRAEMDEVDLRRDGTDLPAEISVMVAEDSEAYREYMDGLDTAGHRAGYRVVPAPGDWAQVDPFGDALIPQDIIQAIIQQLSRGRAS
jgi:pimeloyl-ACP methyl ester carboxylesterase